MLFIAVVTISFATAVAAVMAAIAVLGVVIAVRWCATKGGDPLADLTHRHSLHIVGRDAAVQLMQDQIRLILSQ